MAYIRLRTFFYPCVASALSWKPWLQFQRPQTFSASNHIRYKLNQLRLACSHFKQLLDTRRLLGNSSTSPAQEALEGVTSTATAGLCHCHTEAGSIHSSQVHSNKAAGKNSSRSVSFLRLYDACAYLARSLCSESAGKRANAKKKQQLCTAALSPRWQTKHYFSAQEKNK